MAKTNTNQQSYIVAVLVVIIVVLAAALILSLRDQTKTGDLPAQNTTQPSASHKQLIADTSAYLGEYLGLTAEEGSTKAKADGLTARVVKDEANPNIVITDDLRNDRLNFTIRAGRIAEVELY